MKNSARIFAEYQGEVIEIAHIEMDNDAIDTAKVISSGLVTFLERCLNISKTQSVIVYLIHTLEKFKRPLVQVGGWKMSG